VRKRKKRRVVVLTVLFTLVLIPVGFSLYLEGRIGSIIRARVQESITGTFDFREASLSLLRSFPRARVSLEDIHLITDSPFEGDTLLKLASLELTMDLGELLGASGGPLPIRELHVKGADLRLRVDAQGRPNYLIAKPSDPDPGETGEGFALDLQKYTLEGARISYTDSTSGISFLLEDVQHSGTGDLSLRQSTLETLSEGYISLYHEGNAYLDRNRLHLKALFGIDLERDTYTFRENRAEINAMPVVFDGLVQLRDEGQWIDLTFKTPGSDFRNFLALVPVAYSGSLEGVETRGSFELAGSVKGLWSDSGIPSFEISMRGRDGFFQYPNLPRPVQEIDIDAVLFNTTGNPEETHLNLNKAAFAIARDTFALSGSILRLGEQSEVDVALNGRLDLGNLSEAYPLEDAEGLQGLLRADLQAVFNLASVREKRYQDIKSSGSLEVRGASWPLDGFEQPLEIERASMRFEPSRVNLDAFSGRLGQSDFQVRGTFRDYMGYLLGTGMLRGAATLNSRQLVLADFQDRGDTEANPKDTMGFKLPAKVDLTLQARAGTVLYEALVLNEVQGILHLDGERLEFEEVQSRALDGSIRFDGALDTRGMHPDFNFNLGIAEARIGKALEAVSLFESLVPMARALQGSFNSKVRIQGALKEGFAPDLMSLSGEVVAEVLTAGLKSVNGNAVLGALASNLSFLDLQDLQLKGLKTALSFEKGMVRVKPFRFEYRDLILDVEGSHSFDRSLDYNLMFQVPASYLGGEVNRLLQQLQEPDLEEVRVPVSATLTGSFTNPVLKTDLDASTAAFASQLVEVQKKRLLAGGEKKAKELIGDLLQRERDSNQQSNPVDAKAVSEAVEGIFGSGKRDSSRTDSPTQGSKAEKAARSLLKNLIRTPRDTVNKPKDSIKQLP